MNAATLPALEAAKQSSPGSRAQGYSAPNSASAHGSSSPVSDISQSGSQSALGECVTRTVRRYLADIGDTECAEGLHALVLREVEIPLLREVLAFHDGNQSRAASALGINRATLRKKLAAHGLL